MANKLIFLDIDGTFTQPGSNHAPDSAAIAVKKARANGHKIFLCTGRNYDMFKTVLEYGFDGYVASAGGYVCCDGKVIYDYPMDSLMFKKAMDCLKKNHIFRTVECIDGTYGDSGLDEFLQNADQYSNSELLRFRKQLSENLNIRPMEEYDGSPVYKIVFMCTKMEQLDEPQKLLDGYFKFCIQSLEKQRCINGEIFPKVFDKGTGVRKICEYLGKPISDTIGFGDSMNDLEMIETVGLSVCMGNGNELLKKKSKYVCGDVTEDGLYEAFEKLGLI